MKEHHGNRSVLSTMLNTLLLYPDHPYGLGTLYGNEFDPELERNVQFVIAETQDLPQDTLYAKERRLIEEIKKELAEGRRCQVYAVYTQKQDVTARLERILSDEGIRTAFSGERAHLQARGLVRPEDQRGRSGSDLASETRRNRSGLARLSHHPFLRIRLLVTHPAAGRRRSWRIGQRRPVRVKFLCYESTMQTSCLRLMGKKLLVALTMEGKFAGEGLQNVSTTMTTCSRRWRVNWSRRMASVNRPMRCGRR